MKKRHMRLKVAMILLGIASTSSLSVQSIYSQEPPSWGFSAFRAFIAFDIETKNENPRGCEVETQRRLMEIR